MIRNHHDWSDWVQGICEIHDARRFIIQHERSCVAYTYAEWSAAIASYKLPWETEEQPSVVLFDFDNTVQSLLLFFVLLDRGVKPVLLNSSTTKADREAIAQVLCCQHALAVSGDQCQLAELPLESKEGVFSISSDVAYFVFTSGSSGQPKGIQISYNNAVVEIESMARAYGLGMDDPHLCVLPIYHASGLYRNILMPFSSGASTVLVESFQSEIVVVFGRAVPGFVCADHPDSHQIFAALCGR